MKALSIRNLRKTYTNGFSALKGIDLDVDQGDFFALLGPNGAGKTTLIGIICSLVNKTSGNVLIFDKDLDKDIVAVKSNIGIVPQEFNFAIFETPEQIIRNQAGLYGLPRKVALERTEEYLKRLDLWDKRDQEARMLSGGMKRRLMIARALVHEPKLLILDEPTAGVDIEIRRSMWQLLRDLNEQGITIILTTHYLEEAESLCRNIAIIDHGLIIENTNISHLLTKLDIETFVLYLENPIEKCPNIPEYNCRWIDDLTIEVDLRDSQNMNELFQKLSNQNIYVLRMRNKANRLEELFLNLVGQDNPNYDDE